jgi:hypothetical protein
MPAEAVVMVVAEHPDNPDLLFAGIHNGLLVSTDGGNRWTRAGGNLPPVSINDIKIQDGDLILGTYGRGLIILDDITFLAESNQEVLARDVHLFPVRDAEQHYQNNRDMSNKAARFAGVNPEYGALITYYLKDPSPAGASSGGQTSAGEDASPGEPEVSFQILDADGTVIRELTGPDRQGFNRIAWDLRIPADTTESPGPQQGRRRLQMNDVEPGQYTVKLLARGQEMVQTVTVIPDRRQ